MAGTALFGVLSGLILVAGCSRRIEPPDVSPDDAARQAVAEYDRNKDGQLDAAELERCPALFHSRALIDADKDGKLSPKEIGDRIATYKASRVGLVAVSCRVTLGGQPIPGATVRFVPEKFMGPNVKPAEGVTDATGRVMPTTDGSDVPGVACGCFRIEVTKKEYGQERIPTKYNGPTALGIEVAPETAGTPIRLDLTN